MWDSDRYQGRPLHARQFCEQHSEKDGNDLVAKTEEAYVALAVKLAQDAGYRQLIRERIEASRHVLFEDDAPIRALESFLAKAVVQK